MKKLPCVLSFIVISLIVIEPVYLFLSVSAGHTLGGYEIWRALPFALALVIFLTSILEILCRDNTMTIKFFTDKLNILTFIFLAIVLTSAIFGEANLRAKLAGMMFDTRYFLLFLSTRILVLREPVF